MCCAWLFIIQQICRVFDQILFVSVSTVEAFYLATPRFIVLGDTGNMSAAAEQ